MTLIVGAHPQNLSLSILARRTDLVARLRDAGLSFFVYGAGSQTIPLMRAGVLHLAGTGATPPILAKAEGLATAVFGMSGPRPENGGLLVREASGIRSLHDLKGRGIGADADLLAYAVPGDGTGFGGACMGRCERRRDHPRDR